MEDIVTEDMSKFGYIELKEAGNLLKAYADNNETKYLGDGVRVCFNRNSGKVFLCDGDYNVAVLEDEVLVDFMVCGECGYEGTKIDYDWDKKNGCTKNCCKEYFERED